MKPPIVGVANAQDRPKSKYRNVRTSGHASKKEARRANELRLLEATGKIRNLREQARYEILPKQTGERAIYYVADFVYDIKTPYWTPERDKYVGAWQTVVEDTKSPITRRNPVYVIKRKLMLWWHGIRILET